MMAGRMNQRTQGSEMRDGSGGGHAVVIAGGGPTGLMLAAELALARVDVVVVERRVTAPAAVLIRPDGHVAWVGDGTALGLREALTRWVGPPAA